MNEETSATKLATRSKASTTYLYSWVAVATCGLAYVGVAATRPELIGTILPLADQATDQAFNSRAAADMADEIATLRKWVHDMQHELATAKSALQDQAAQNTALTQRISAAEERLPANRETRAEAAAKLVAARARTAQVPVQSQQAPAQAPAAQAAQVAQVAGVPTFGGDQPSPPAPAADVSNVRVINSAVSAQPAQAAITTGSVQAAASPAPAAAGFGPAKVTPAGPPRGIEIAASDSLDSLRAKWGDLAGRNTETLGDLAPRYRLATDGRAAPFTLVAGPFGSPADAAKTCAQLKAKGVVCRVSDYSGSAF